MIFTTNLTNDKYNDTRQTAVLSLLFHLTNHKGDSDKNLLSPDTVIVVLIANQLAQPILKWQSG